jgi:hypothetical protein
LGNEEGEGIGGYDLESSKRHERRTVNAAIYACYLQHKNPSTRTRTRTSTIGEREEEGKGEHDLGTPPNAERRTLNAYDTKV